MRCSQKRVQSIRFLIVEERKHELRPFMNWSEALGNVSRVSFDSSRSRALTPPLLSRVSHQDETSSPTITGLAGDSHRVHFTAEVQFIGLDRSIPCALRYCDGSRDVVTCLISESHGSMYPRVVFPSLVRTYPLCARAAFGRAGERRAGLAPCSPRARTRTRKSKERPSIKLHHLFPSPTIPPTPHTTARHPRAS